MFVTNIRLKKSNKKAKTFKTIRNWYEMSVYLSNKHIYCQLIDLKKSITLKCCSSLSKNLESVLTQNSSILSSYILGLKMRISCHEDTFDKVDISLSLKNTHSNRRYRFFNAGFNFFK